MTDFSDDDNYATYEGVTAADSDDGQEDVDPNEIYIEDPEENTICPVELIREIEQPQQIANEPEETLQYQDDIDEPSSDSGKDDEVSSQGTNEPEKPPEIRSTTVSVRFHFIYSCITLYVKLQIGRGRGRGRLGKEAIDEAGKPLAQATIRDAPEDGFYSKPGKKISLPVKVQLNYVFFIQTCKKAAEESTVISFGVVEQYVN